VNAQYQEQTDKKNNTYGSNLFIKEDNDKDIIDGVSIQTKKQENGSKQQKRKKRIFVS